MFTVLHALLVLNLVQKALEFKLAQFSILFWADPWLDQTILQTFFGPIAGAAIVIVPSNCMAL